jgi:hypothetical protein
VFNNTGLCGAIVSVGSVGTSYNGNWDGSIGGLNGTALGTACTSRVEDQIAYLNCIRNPSTCTDLYAARPPPPGSVCEPVTRSPSLSGRAGGGGGTQEPGGNLGHAGAHGHHPYDRGDVNEPHGPVRFLPPSTLHVALDDGG